MTTLTKFKTITEALQALPVGADAIAAHLGELGVKGVCGNSHRCAIADYLVRNVEPVPGTIVRVGNRTARFIQPAEPFHSIQNVFFDTIGGDEGRNDIGDFILGFDGHRYPSLIGSIAEAGL